MQRIGMLFFVLLFSTNVFSQPASLIHTLVVPQCLLKHTLQGSFQILARQNKFALVFADEKGIAALVQAKISQERNAAQSPCGGFMDVTSAFHDKQHRLSDGEFLQSYIKHPVLKPVDYRIRYQKQVYQLLGQINPQMMWDKLTKLSNLKDRYANSVDGLHTAGFLKQEIEVLAEAKHRNDIKVNIIMTPRYKQPSVVAVIGNQQGPGIVIGAHMDTLSSMFSTKPGADDDGSGSATVLEVARTIIDSGMKFKKPIYFIWYAAEEEGLVGSGAVVDTFRKQHIPIDAVLHFDMTGYDYKNEDTMWLMDDYVNAELVSYISQLINTYVKKPVKHSRCGYACSDHARWTQAGYRAAIPAEAAYEHSNPYMHTSQDTLNHLSLAHMTDYLKLATAFAVEMAEPTH